MCHLHRRRAAAVTLVLIVDLPVIQLRFDCQLGVIRISVQLLVLPGILIASTYSPSPLQQLTWQ